MEVLVLLLEIVDLVEGQGLTGVTVGEERGFREGRMHPSGDFTSLPLFSLSWGW